MHPRRPTGLPHQFGSTACLELQRLQANRPMRCRPRSIYQRSLDLLVQAKKLAPDLLTKTGLMVGLGETFDELKKAIMDIRETQCDILTIGQYLPPSKKHLNLRRYYTPDEFNQLEEEAINLGFAHVEAGPMVRSSYHARRHIPPVS